MVWDNESLDKGSGFWIKGLGLSSSKAVICLVAPMLHCRYIAKPESSVGAKIAHRQKNRCRSHPWITEGSGRMNLGKNCCLWVRKGLQVPWGSLQSHIRYQGIHRNALLSDRLLMASTAYVGFNICILIYLTSAEHPKKIFSMGWAIRLLSEFIKYLTLLFQMFSVLQKLRMHFAKHVLC